MLIQKSICYALLAMFISLPVLAQNSVAGRYIALIDPGPNNLGECDAFNEVLNSLLDKRSGKIQLAIFMPSTSLSISSIKKPVIGSSLRTFSSWIKLGDKITYYALEQPATMETINLLQQIIKDHSVALDIHLFTAINNGVADRSNPELKKLSLKQIPCQNADNEDFSKPDVTSKARRLVADYLRVPLPMVQPDTHLIHDLSIDQTRLYELSQFLTDAFDVAPVPNSQALTRVSELIAHIQDPENQPGIRSRGITGQSEEKEVYLQSVFFGTSRERTSSSNPSEMFSGDRSSIKKISYGTVEVSIPKSHKSGALESPFLGLKMFRDPKDHIFLSKVNPLSRVLFNQLLEQKIVNGTEGVLSKDAIVFIHGFNVSFEEAARRTAQIALDINFTGIPLFFSWPSDAELLGYMSDREDAIWSVAYVEKFLQNLVAINKIERIHIIAHSMGNQALIGALHRIAIKQRAHHALFENIILAAPDFDAQLFEQQIAVD